MVRGIGARDRRPGRRSAAVGVAVVVLAAMSATACSSSGSAGASSSGSGSGSVRDGLRHIHDTAQTSSYFSFGEPAQVVKLNGGQGDSGPFSVLAGAGADELRNWYKVLDPITGLDLNSVTTALTVGRPPANVEILYGSFDADAIGAKFAAWGYKKQDRGDGVTAWIWRDNHEIDAGKVDPDTGIGPGMDTGWLNVVWVSKTRVAYGRATADLAAALPEQSEPLSGDSVVGPLADCLGSALTGIVLNGPPVTGDPAIPAMAVGVTATGPADIREEICVAAPDDATAQKFATAFTTAISNYTDFRSDMKWSAELTDPKTEKLGGEQHVVRLSARPAGQGRPDFVTSLVYNADYETLLGLPMKTKNGMVVNPDGSQGSASAPATDSSPPCSGADSGASASPSPVC